jgi:mannosyltransferase OCH1-like enzyme
MKADIFRYCIVYDRGGYYFDISKGISAKITDLHSANAREFLSFEKNSVPASWTQNSNLDLIRPNNLLIQWGFGFEPKHEILGILIKQICTESEKFEKKYFSSPKAAILELTGPIAFTRAVWKYMGEFDQRIYSLDFDFDGLGIYAMKGAGARHLKFPSYAHATNMMILNDAWNKE